MKKINLNFFKKIPSATYVSYLPDFKKEKTQQFVTVVFTFVALTFFALFAINPTLSTIAKLKKELKDDQFVEQQLKQKIANLQSLQNEYGEVEKDLEVVLKAIPENPDAPILVADIQGFAVSENVNLTGTQVFEVEVSKADTPLGYSSFVFSLTAEGSYENLYNFIEKLSRMRRIISFESISLTKTSSDNSNLVLNLKGNSFFKK